MSGRAERLSLLLHPGTRIHDPSDTSTWLVAGLPASAEQAEALGRLTLAELDDAETLLRLDLELTRRETLAVSREVVAAMRVFLRVFGAAPS